MNILVNTHFLAFSVILIALCHFAIMLYIKLYVANVSLLVAFAKISARPFLFYIIAQFPRSGCRQATYNHLFMRRSDCAVSVFHRRMAGLRMFFIYLLWMCLLFSDDHTGCCFSGEFDSYKCSHLSF